MKMDSHSAAALDLEEEEEEYLRINQIFVMNQTRLGSFA
jgi:hypothetical protein